jgi:hypothetical protein
MQAKSRSGSAKGRTTPAVSVPLAFPKNNLDKILIFDTLIRNLWVHRARVP